MKSSKSKSNSSLKNQPKISNFLVPGNSNNQKSNSPSKQLKISKFFNKIDRKNVPQKEEIEVVDIEENSSICMSPEFIPPSPKLQTIKRKNNNDENNKGKRIKLNNYKKILYDGIDTSKSNEPLKPQQNKNDSERNIDVSQNKSDINISQLKNKANAPQPNIKKIVSQPNTNISQHKANINVPKQNRNISQHKVNINVRKQNGNISQQKANVSQQLNNKDNKANEENKNKNIEQKSLINNDEFLNELLGEINTNVSVVALAQKETINNDKNTHDDFIHKNNIKNKNNDANDAKNETNDIEITNSLVNDGKRKSNNINDAKHKTINDINDAKHKHKDVNDTKHTSNDVYDAKHKHNDVNDTKHTSNDVNDAKHKHNDVNDVKDKNNDVETTESFLKLYGIKMKSHDDLKVKSSKILTPEKNSLSSEKNILTPEKILLTPEKKSEMSSISQEVTQVLSITKSPRLVNSRDSKHKKSPIKMKEIDLSLISKINFDDNDEENDWNFAQIEYIDLTTFKKCEILSINYRNSTLFQLDLKILDLSLTKISCLISGCWINTQIQIGDIITIKAEYDNQYQSWIVDNTRGLLVYHPDILVSGTTIVGSLFCMRKSILSDLFKGVDSGSSIMILGILLHQMLQEVLKNNLNTESSIKELILNTTSSQDVILMMYSSCMSLIDTRKELETFIPKILNFIQTYVAVDRSSDQTKKQNIFNDKNKINKHWDGKIIEIQDIEENIWLPNLGVKGKVDVTVKVRSKSNIKTMPLELKTGRASKSAEHRGQVILYAMMMSEMEQTVDSGLLLYLRENVLDEIKAGHPEKRDLMMLRNQLVFYLNQDITSVDVPHLPPPINHHSACAKCPYLYICSAALSEENDSIVSNDNPLKSLSKDSMSNRTSKHIRFVFHMVALLRIEFKESKERSKQLSDVWILNPEQRELRGDCICNLKLKPEIQNVKGRYHCILYRSYPIQTLLFNISQYVIVSSSTQPAVASGFISCINESSISLNLDRDLTSLGCTTKFHIDTYESQSLLSFNLIGLGLLLQKDYRNSNELCSLVIDKQLPQFSKKYHASILDVGNDLFIKLNPGQKRAVLKSLTAKQYLLIKGMPGTGKSSTLACLIELFVRLKLSVLVTSHTHSAVDNLLVRLIDKVSFLRLGSISRIHPKIIPYCENICTKHCKSPEELADFYATKSVVGVTCMGSVHPLLQKRIFDVCIVDEATQVLLPAVLPPLLASKKFILVGDPEQLCPLVISKKASDLGLSESLFSRLDRTEVTTCLTAQYRMNGEINKLVNNFTYKGQLECADEIIQNATLPKLNLPPDNSYESWLHQCVSNQLKHSVIFLNISCDKSNTIGESATNQNEASIVKKLVEMFEEGGIETSSIGVIATYRNQVSLLKRVLPHNTEVEVSTVDQYQGRDKDIIIYSSSCHTNSKNCKIFNDKKRLTVAISRSKYKLIIIGDLAIIKQKQNVFYELINYVCETNIIHVPCEQI